MDILQHLVAGFGVALSPTNLLIAAIGCFIGTIVGLLPGRPELRAGTSEVDRILYVPLAELIRSDTYREERWGVGETARSIYFFELEDETVWGATGRMLVQLLCLATGVPDKRP